MLLSKVGYWRPLQRRHLDSAEDAALPDPREFVDTTWDSALRSRVAGYLKNGRIWAFGFGYSYCRFQCGAPDSTMGSNVLTDGIWVWPEGLWHYVEAHAVRLPPQFFGHLMQRDFRHLTDTEFCNPGALDDGEPCHTAAELYERIMAGVTNR